MKLLLVALGLVAFTSAYIVPAGHHELIYYPDDIPADEPYKPSTSAWVYEDNIVPKQPHEPSPSGWVYENEDRNVIVPDVPHEASPSGWVYEYEDNDKIEHSPRARRSLQPGAPTFPVPGAKLPTSVSSNIEKIGDNTVATIKAQHETDRYDVGAKWSKVVRGPARGKPNFSIGGTYRW